MFSLFRSKAGTALREMTPREVKDKLDRKAITLVDVREESEWRAGRIPGAVHVPLSRLEAGAVKIPQDRPVVLHCLSGARSARALAACQKLGLPIDTYMAGGISSWSSQGLPVER
jgi:rhodanese-related sulfurtransferase